MDRQERNDANPGMVERRLDDAPMQGSGGADVEREGTRDGGGMEREGLGGRGVEREGMEGGGVERDAMRGREAERGALAGEGGGRAFGGERMDRQDEREGGYGADASAEVAGGPGGMQGGAPPDGEGGTDRGGDMGRSEPARDW